MSYPPGRSLEDRPQAMSPAFKLDRVQVKTAHDRGQAKSKDTAVALNR